MGTALSKKPVVWHIGGEDIHMRIPLLLALRERGFSVGAVGSEDGELFKETGIPYWRFNFCRFISPIQDIKSIRELRALFTRERPDIVHGFDTKPAIMVPLAGKVTGIPVRVCTITGLGYMFSSHSPLVMILRPLYRYLQRRASAYPTFTIFQNPDDHIYFLRHNIVPKGREAVVLGSGIDTNSFLSYSPKPALLQSLKEELGLKNSFVVCMAARIVKYKGVLEYLEAAKLVHLRNPLVTFLLVGPLSSEGNQAVSRGIIDAYSDHVIYAGPRSDVRELLALTNLFVLPSYYLEGVPRILLEAGAMGIPLITTDMPGCREVVRDGWNGFIIPPRDNLALASAIEKVIRMNASERRILGQRSQEHVQLNFSLSLVADAYATIYHQCLKEFGAHYQPGS